MKPHCSEAQICRFYDNIISIFENLLFLRIYAKDLTNISIFNHLNSLVRDRLLSLFYNEKTETLSKLPKVTELVTVFRSL